MAAKTADKRAATVTVSRPEMSTFLGNAAKNAGLIDFDPQTVDVFDQGDQGFEIVFGIDLPTGGQ
jgi:hypothetical protein